ncbi:MAG: iron-containing redox enzyme family protein [Thermoanaerobaculia bacterium]|nr:iron-containing redox enzyme family protein [Thermoanaerobaculia bacterium]
MSAAVLPPLEVSVPRRAEEAQSRLSRLNEARLSPRLDGPALSLEKEVELRKLERAFLEAERAAVAERAASAPRDVEAFISWFESLREFGPGQNDPLFPWLATAANREEIGWFLSQEVAGEAGFDDLVALTQLRFPVRAKLEMARNYWDEMGRGKEPGMHGPMLDRLASDLRLESKSHEIAWEAVAIGNLLMGLAANREYAYHSVGALGAIELTAPSRATHVSNGLERLGIPLRTRRYYALHATLDVKHSIAWNEEVLKPLVRDDPRVALPIAEGALMRLNAGARCFARYREVLGR